MVFSRTDPATGRSLQFQLIEWRAPRTPGLGTRDGEGLAHHQPVLARAPAERGIETDLIEIGRIAPAISQLCIGENGVAERPAPQRTDLPGLAAIAKRPVRDILALAGNQRRRLQRDNRVIILEGSPAETQLAGGKSGRAIEIGPVPTADILPGNARNRSQAVADSQFAVERDLVLVEISIINDFAITVPGPVGPVMKCRDDGEALALFLGPGSGLCGRRGARCQAGGNQVSKPGLSRRTRSRTAAQAISLKNSLLAISDDWSNTRSCIF